MMWCSPANSSRSPSDETHNTTIWNSSFSFDVSGALLTAIAAKLNDNAEFWNDVTVPGTTNIDQDKLDYRVDLLVRGAYKEVASAGFPHALYISGRVSATDNAATIVSSYMKSLPQWQAREAREESEYTSRLSSDTAVSVIPMEKTELKYYAAYALRTSLYGRDITPSYREKRALMVIAGYIATKVMELPGERRESACSNFCDTMGQVFSTIDRAGMTASKLARVTIGSALNRYTHDVVNRLHDLSMDSLVSVSEQIERVIGNPTTDLWKVNPLFLARGLLADAMGDGVNPRATLEELQERGTAMLQNRRSGPSTVTESVCAASSSASSVGSAFPVTRKRRASGGLG